MSSLGVMMEATFALYAMEMEFVHRQAVGSDNCFLVKWTTDSLTRICWSTSDGDRVTFSTGIHLHGDRQLDDLERFVDLLNAVAPADTGQLACERRARLDGNDLVVETSVVIADATYSGEVEHAYALALQEVMSIESAIG